VLEAFTQEAVMAYLAIDDAEGRGHTASHLATALCGPATSVWEASERPALADTLLRWPTPSFRSGWSRDCWKWPATSTSKPPAWPATDSRVKRPEDITAEALRPRSSPDLLAPQRAPRWRGVLSRGWPAAFGQERPAPTCFLHPGGAPRARFQFVHLPSGAVSPGLPLRLE